MLTRIKRVSNPYPVRFSKRVSNPPVRFPFPVHYVESRRVVLKPFQGQPRIFKKAIRLPRLIIQQSRIPKAGFGLFLAERVRAGQPLTKYSTKRISESFAIFLKMKVDFFALLKRLYLPNMCLLLLTEFLYRAIATLERTILLAFVLIPSQPRRKESTTSAIVTKPPASPTHRVVQMRNSWM